MLQTLLIAAMQYMVPAIINAVVAHQKAAGVVLTPAQIPTPAQVIATAPELAILAQGQAYLATLPPV